MWDSILDALPGPVRIVLFAAAVGCVLGGVTAVRFDRGDLVPYAAVAGSLAGGIAATLAAVVWFRWRRSSSEGPPTEIEPVVTRTSGRRARR